MKTMVLGEFGKPLVREEVPEPGLTPEDVLIESRANGLCATGLTVVDGLLKTAEPPPYGPAVLAASDEAYAHIRELCTKHIGPL